VRSWRIVAVAAVGVALLSSCSYELLELQPELPANAQSSIIYAADGTEIVTLHAEENRTDLTLDDIPLHVRDAVIAIEDERFWLHNGVDLRAILRAVSVNASEGEISQGGSTITQQLVKQLLLGSEQTLDRKVQEAALAWQLENRYTKERILELYLNTIYLGNGAYGLSAASEKYFDKTPDLLTVAEGALLAGLIQAPNDFDPFDDPAQATARRDLVLDAMLDQDLIDESVHAAAMAEPLQLAPPVPVVAERYVAGHFVEEVKQWILDDPRFGATSRERRELLFTGGLRVHTTIDLRAQAAAEAAINEVLPDPNGPDAALVAVEPHTGYVRVMVGGRDFFGADEQAKVNLAMGRGRHTGSAFKPIVLAAALEDGVPLNEMFPAPSRVELQCPNGSSWDVENYEGSGPGAPVDLAEATVKSYNTVYAQLILRVGVERSIEVAHAMGITRPLDAVCSAVLGANDVQVLEMASAFATLANRGVHVTPVLVTSIVRADGTIVYEAPHEQRRAIDPEVADTVTSVLQQAVARGTGTSAQLPGRAVAGKTGTGQGWRNAWFCGFTPQLAAAVWMGFPQEQFAMVPPRTSRRVTGGSFPAQIWQRFMSVALGDAPALGFHPPPPTTTTTLAAEPYLPPTPTTGAPFVLPDIRGHSAGDVFTLLSALGFRVSAVRGRLGATPGTVTAMSPPPGTAVGVGGRVTIEVAPDGAAPVTVPGVIGLDVDAATRVLRRAGLEAQAEVSANPGGPTPPGRVWAQAPAAGSQAALGSTVQLAVQPP
jgi:penicillin-binding protein 1A